MVLWKDKEKSENVANESTPGSGDLSISDGYTAAEGLNSSTTTYQDASGAPVETNSPLGYSVGFMAAFFLNINQMVGTGIFSTQPEAATILSGVGSVGLSMIYWFIGYLVSQSILSLYLEYTSYFPSRSGSEVVYLEQAFPKPQYLIPTIFAAKHVIFSFASSNAVVMAQYVFGIGGVSYTDWQMKGVAVALYTLAYFVVCASTKWSLRLVVWFGIFKILTLVLISIAGLVVLGGHTKVEDPGNWKNPWQGTSDASAYGATNAMVKLIFSYQGYTNAFGVVNEIKNPVKTLRWTAPISLFLVAGFYILVNVAYFSAASRGDILASKQVAASIFFEKVFGKDGGSNALDVLVCLSTFGNLIAVLVNTSRLLRETGRQGVLPWPKFWTSVKPFGTPIGPYTVQWALTILMIICPPAGDAFNFVVDLAVYPTNIFNLLLVIGLLIIRRRRKKLNLPSPEYSAWPTSVAFALLVMLYLLIAPWYPPDKGANGGDVSFWYGTYLVVGIGLIVACIIYYYFWIDLIPKYKGYEFRQTVIQYEDGSIAHQLVKVPKEEIESWDSQHDSSGHPLS